MVRRLRLSVVLLSTVALLGAPGAAFGQTAPDPDAVPQLTPGTTAPSTTTASPSTSTSSGRGQTPSQALPSALPNTGLDGRILAGIGAGLLLCGVGLRLRTARERF